MMDEQQILPSKLKDVSFKISQLIFIPDEQKMLPSELILFRMNKI